MQFMKIMSTYSYILSAEYDDIWTPITRYLLSDSAILGIYSAQILRGYANLDKVYNKNPRTNFRLQSEIEVAPHGVDTTRNQAYGLLLNDLTSYERLATNGEFHILRLYMNEGKLINMSHAADDNDPFTHLIRFYDQGNDLNTPAVKVFANNVLDFVGGFLLYFQLLCRYSRIATSEDFVIYECPNSIPTGVSIFRSTIEGWFFLSMVKDVQAHIISYTPKEFRYLSRDYYELTMKVNDPCKTVSTGTLRSVFLSRLRTGLYSSKDLISMISRASNTYNRLGLYNKAFILSSAAGYDVNVFKYLLDREKDLSPVLKAGKRTLSHWILNELTEKFDFKHRVSEISNRLESFRYLFARNDLIVSNDDAIAIFNRDNYDLSLLLLETGRVDPYIIDLNNANRSLISALYSYSEFDPNIGGIRFIDRALYWGDIDLVRKIFSDPRIDPSMDNNKYLLYALMPGGFRETRNIKEIMLEAILLNPRLDIHRGDNAIIPQLASLQPQSLLVILSPEDLKDREFMNTFVTPYINISLLSAQFLEDVRTQRPDILEYLLIVPGFKNMYT